MRKPRPAVHHSPLPRLERAALAASTIAFASCGPALDGSEPRVAPSAFSQASGAEFVRVDPQYESSQHRAIVVIAPPAPPPEQPSVVYVRPAAPPAEPVYYRPAPPAPVHIYVPPVRPVQVIPAPVPAYNPPLPIHTRGGPMSVGPSPIDAPSS